MSTAVAERAAPADMTPAQRQKHRLDQFMGAIEKRQDQIGTLLADSGIDPRLFLETCRRSLMRDPELINCDPASFIQAALNCAADGLVPDGRKAAIIRFKGSAQYLPMYQGLLDVAYRSGNFQSIAAHVVYEGDEFDYDMGDNPFIRHKRPLESTSTKIIGAYAIARTTNGGVFREVMGAAELAKVRAVSRATKGPNVDWPGEMARKAPVRRMWKYLPKTPNMDRVAIHDDATYDHGALPAANEPTRQLRPGFNPPAIAHQPTEEAPAVPMDEILDGDFVPAFDGADEAPAPEADKSMSQKPAADEVDDGFPGDRPTPASAEGQTLAGPDFDPASWAIDFNTQVHKLESVDEITAAWTDAQAKGYALKLKAHSPAKLKALVDSMNQRVAEIEGKG